MKVSEQLISLDAVPPAEVAKAEAAARARDQLAMIQHGCRSLDELPEPVFDDLARQFSEVIFGLMEAYGTPLGRFQVGN